METFSFSFRYVMYNYSANRKTQSMQSTTSLFNFINESLVVANKIITLEKVDTTNTATILLRKNKFINKKQLTFISETFCKKYKYYYSKLIKMCFKFWQGKKQEVISSTRTNNAQFWSQVYLISFISL